MRSPWGAPLGESEARIATTLINHVNERGIQYGLQAMCEGDGQANATIFELVDRLEVYRSAGPVARPPLGHSAGRNSLLCIERCSGPRCSEGRC